MVTGDGSVEWQSCGGPECYNSEVVVPPDPVAVEFSAKDAVTGDLLDGFTYTVYAQYPTDFEDCNGAECGVEIASGSSVSVPASSDYLVVVSGVNTYYTKYYEISVETDATMDVGPISMVEVMIAGQKRVVLSWGHFSDLNMQVVNADNRGESVTYNEKGDMIDMAGGWVMLDADDGGPGVETIQFQGVNNGEVEVWVHHYSSAFSVGQTSAYPASVDVYCDTCTYDEQTGQVGYVTTVVQDYTMLTSDPVYWLVGTFSGSGSDVTWTTCTGTCYFSSAGYTQTAGSLMGGRRRRSKAVAATPRANPAQKKKEKTVVKKAAPARKTRRRIFPQSKPV